MFNRQQISTSAERQAEENQLSSLVRAFQVNVDKINLY